MSVHSGSLWKPLFAASILFHSTCAFGQTTRRVAETVDPAQWVTLHGNVHPLARAEYDRGAVDDSLPMMRILLLLKRSGEQELALRNYLSQQQDKKSPNYHSWLTPEQFGAKYGPSDADIQAVTQWLESQGFRIDTVHSGKTVIEFSGTAGQVRKAFATSVRKYEVSGKTYVANASDPQIPAALARVVVGPVSLNNFPRHPQVRVLGTARKILGQPGFQPDFSYHPFPGEPGYFYALAPGDFATIYNSLPLILGTPAVDGTGQTIAIVGETNINPADVASFQDVFGLPIKFTAANVIVNGQNPGIVNEEETEADLDTQWSGAVAPGATVDLVVSATTQTTQGVDLSALYIIDQNLAGVMSESYSACESELGTAGNAHDDIWLVSFMDYDLGYFDLETRVLEPLENPFGPKALPMS